MINHNIIYERDINKSYLKMPAINESSLDEKLIFRRNYPGILPMEKCYVDGCGQYWYDISGKQALDAYCRINSIHHSFFEMLILRICSQLELLEWNLIDTRCLIVDPEFIFVNHLGEDVFFLLHPEPRENFWEELRHLMEFLLTKLNHSDKDGVHQVYHIYNMILAEECSMADLKQSIFDYKKVENTPVDLEETIVIEEDVIECKKDSRFQAVEQKIASLTEKIKEILRLGKTKKEEVPMVVYPEEEPMEPEVQLYPTICLATTVGDTKGILIYKGPSDYPDFVLEKECSILGKNPRVKLFLNRETVSQFHAKFDYIDGKYFIEDMNSTNGTYVNDVMLSYREKKSLSVGDVLCFADVKYQFM